MKKLLILLLLLSTSIGVFAQLIPGVVASSYRVVKEESEEPGEPPEFLMTDGYTFSWLTADINNVSLSGDRIILVEDVGPSGNDFAPPFANVNVNYDEGEEAFYFFESNSNLTSDATPSGNTVAIYVVFRVLSDGNLCVLNSNRVLEIDDGTFWVQIDGWLDLDTEIDYETKYAVLCYQLNANNSFLEINGTDMASGTYSGFTGGGAVYLGYAATAFRGYIKEAIIRNVLDTEQNKLNVVTYLMDKYGIE